MPMRNCVSAFLLGVLLLAACQQVPKNGEEVVRGGGAGQSSATSEAAGGGGSTPSAPEQQAPAVPKVPAVGKPMPPFEFTTLDGEKDQLQDYLGKPLLVNLWGTRCGPCRAEIPDLVEFYRAHKDEDVEIISLSVDDSVKDVKNFLRTQEMPWVLGLDTSGVARRWGLRGIPTTYFIDRQGRVVHIRPGAMSREMMESLAAPLFAEEDSTTPGDG